MILATLPSATTSAQYSAAEDDRSLGEAGKALRDSLREAMSSTIDRGDEIYSRVSAALRNAQQSDGTLTSPEGFGRTLELLNRLPREIPLPQVVVESENEIGLDWDEGRGRVLSLTVRDTSMLGFAALFGEEPLHGRMRFTDEIPETLRFLFCRLYPTSR
jgi:hypothetical protein